MYKPNIYLILMAFFITLEIYRIPFPLIGYNIAIYHVILFIAVYLGMISIIYKNHIRFNSLLKLSSITIILFIVYSMLEFLRNVEKMYPESKSIFLAECVGYIMVLTVPIFVYNWNDFKKIVVAFLTSSMFIYLGSFYHLFMWIVKNKYVVNVPFWHIFSRSAYVKSYLSSVKWFGGLPRFRLPFSSPAGTGLFLSLSGVAMFAFLLQSFSAKKKYKYFLLVLNLINLFCLLGTFARTGWAIYIVGSLFVLWNFQKYKLISLRRIINLINLGLVIFIFFIISINLIPKGNKFIKGIILRLNPKLTYASNVGHLKSRFLAFHYWADEPIVGLGIGGFWLRPGGGIHTHSTYFTILVNRGLIGLIFYLSFIFSLYQLLEKSISSSYKKGNKDVMCYGIALLGGLTGLFIGHFLYQINSEIVWFFYSLILAFGNLKIPTNKVIIFERN